MSCELFRYFFLTLNLSGTSIWEQFPAQPGQLVPQQLLPFFLFRISVRTASATTAIRIRLTTIVPRFDKSHSTTGTSF